MPDNSDPIQESNVEEIKKTMKESPALLLKLQTVFKPLLENQYRLRKLMRRLQSAEHISLIGRNIRVLEAIDAGMQRFVILSADNEGEDIWESPSQLEKDVAEQRPESEEPDGEGSV